MTRRVAGLVAALLLAGCGLRPQAPDHTQGVASQQAAARQVGPITRSGQGYRQTEEGITVVHLKGSDAEIREQYRALLKDEIAAAADVLRRNRVFRSMTQGGCTNFVAFGPAAAGGGAWHGRTFDFYGLGAMDRYRVVAIVEPDGAIPYASIGWADPYGDAWAHTGMNAAGISLGYMWADAVGERIRDAPLLWRIYRGLLAHARTLPEAVAFLRDSQRLSAANLLLSDGKVPDAVVVEMTSRRLELRSATGGAIHATNHFITRAMRQPIKDPHSEARYARLGALLAANSGRVDLGTSVSFLRDHLDVLTGRETFGGNTIAWNINVAAVVFSPGDLTFWVSRDLAPAVYGRFVGFSLKDELRGTQAKTVLPMIPEDPVTRTPAYRGFLAYQAGYIAAMEGDFETAVAKVREAIPSDPKSGRYRYTLANAYMNLGRHSEAIQGFEDALATDMDDLLRAYSHFRLGQIYERSGQGDLMRKAFARVLELATGDREIEDHARRVLGTTK